MDCKNKDATAMVLLLLSKAVLFKHMEYNGKNYYCRYCNTGSCNKHNKSKGGKDFKHKNNCPVLTAKEVLNES